VATQLRQTTVTVVSGGRDALRILNYPTNCLSLGGVLGLWSTRGWLQWFVFTMRANAHEVNPCEDSSGLAAVGGAQYSVK